MKDPGMKVDINDKFCGVCGAPASLVMYRGIAIDDLRTGESTFTPDNVIYRCVTHSAD
jgi:hypothetical protein